MNADAQATQSAGGGDEYLTRAQALVQALEAGDGGDVDRLIDELTTLRETQLYQQLGRLTRELHDSLISFCEDSRFGVLARDEIPNARERLKYVITLTQQSAEKTLSAVEECVPLAERISDQAIVLRQRWADFRERRMSLSQFRELSTALDEFLEHTAGDAGQLHAGLSDVLMAQEFQDLTGQVIQRVIALVDEVEQKMVSIIALSSERETAAGDAARNPLKAEGPAVPALNSKELVSGQDEVDELLSSLGF